MIPHSFIQDLLARVDIVQIIESHIPLKRAGSNYSARCPFHNEKTPSFTVSPTKQFYHCFGCGAHGTAIGFLMEYHGMGFVEAVRDLAARAGLSLPEQSPGRRQAEESGDELIDALERAARFYRAELKRSERAIGYLKGRGLTGEIAARYGLGYAPNGWQALEAVFREYQSSKALALAGLVIDAPEGRRYDRFRDRVMFPIVNSRGAIVGFGGRVIDSGEPKYLNSPETPVFEKGRELYGLPQARQAIREAGKIVVVEGYMDVVALAQHEVSYAVATLGTATTPWQVQKLLRQTDTVVYCFDGDDAGRRAAWRALENTLSQLVDGKRVAFLFLPEGEDPDSYVRSRGRQAFEGILEQAQPLSEFMLHGLAARTELRTAEGRAKFLLDAKPLVKQVGAPILSLTLRKRAAELAGVSQNELDQQFEIKRDSPRGVTQRRAAPEPSVLRKLAEMLAFEPALARQVDPELLGEFADTAHTQFPEQEFQLVRSLLTLLSERPGVRGIAEHFRGDPLQALAQEVEAASIGWQERRLDEAALAADFTGAWDQLLERLRKARVSALLEKSKHGGWSDEDKELYRRLQRPGNSRGPAEAEQAAADAERRGSV
jgi:DNA primase